jgi:O-antigen/teichoic acid export membrane protein
VQASLPKPESSGLCAASSGRAETTRRHLRGSNLLLFGRLISVCINLLVNVLLVRYLSRGEYGAFAYGLAIAAVGANVLVLGMPRAVGRFAPLYHERGEYGAMFGSLLLSTGLVACLGVLGLVAFFTFGEPLAAGWVKDPLALQLTVILIGLAPLHALDSLFESMLTVFAGSKALFFRRYVLGPLLRLSAVLLVMLFSGGAAALAWTYLGASLLGLALYGPLLSQALGSTGLLQELDLARLRFRWRELLAFGLPLVVADVLFNARAPVVIVLLETLRDTGEVADLNAFLKIAGLNLIVLQSMKLLFMPVAARMLARDEHDSIDHIYWQTTIWTAVLTFPIFLPCIAMPDSVALWINGPGYVHSSAVLVVLAVGEYLNAALGLNGYTLNVYARVRFLLWTTGLATLSAVLIAWWLVPGYGALGAAFGLSAGIVVQNALHQWGLSRYTQVEALRWKYLGVYASLGAAALLVVAVQVWLEPPLLVGAALVVAATLLLLRLNRRTMDLADVLPELRRLPILGRFLFPQGPVPGRAGEGSIAQRGSHP